MNSILLFAGGLGLLIYGMRMMTSGLESAAGNRLKRVLGTVTKSKLSGVLTGTAVTSLVQSSSAVSVMLIGFVNAGILTLLQAVCVNMGANIGTTVTAQLIAFNLTNAAPFILFAGVLMMFFFKNKTVGKMGVITAGLGMMFIGLMLMTQALEPLKDVPKVSALLLSFNRYPMLAVLDGAVLSALMQSSSAVMGIIQAIALQGMLTLDSAVFLILGLNIGTCITAFIASIGLGKAAKKVAVVNLIFNILGSAIFYIAIVIAPDTLDLVRALSPGNTIRQFANFHTLFNIISTLIFMWFPGWLIKISGYFVKEKTRKQLS
ncbi:MAG: Na/Pi cotransporter family protein [Christensenellales bacterium]|jgi:phosphate:Na+ symporter